MLCTMTPDITQIYTDIATWFDETRGRSLMEKPYLDRAMGLSKGKTLLDLGCGTAEPLAAYFITHGYHVTGVDGAPSMIDLCRARFADHSWLVADMRGLDLGAQFDIVIAWHSFFHLTADEQRAMFPVFVHHLKDGGILMFTSGSREGVAWGEMQGHKIHHASLSTQEYTALAHQHSLRVVDHSTDDPNCGGATVWTLQKTAGTP